MGLDYHAMSFLRHVGREHAFGETVTIARQEIHLNEVVLRRLLPLRADYRHQAFCEDLLIDYFGASRVDSLDFSDFEHATHIHDMNLPLPEHLWGRYDTVIDSGCIEHVYNAPQALKNCSLLCREGGTIVHVLPANNFCGHGFWQFSPELFFSLYSPANGYRDTEVFVSDYVDKRRWFRVKPPSDGRRVNILSSSELSVMVRTVRENRPFSHASVQQSDYVTEWQEAETRVTDAMAVPRGLRGAIIGSRFLHAHLFPLYHRLKRLRSVDRLSARNPGLEPVSVEELPG
jgi:SAM-dependent methyltransferase